MRKWWKEIEWSLWWESFLYCLPWYGPSDRELAAIIDKEETLRYLERTRRLEAEAEEEAEEAAREKAEKRTQGFEDLENPDALVDPAIISWLEKLLGSRILADACKRGCPPVYVMIKDEVTFAAGPVKVLWISANWEMEPLGFLTLHLAPKSHFFNDFVAQSSVQVRLSSIVTVHREEVTT